MLSLSAGEETNSDSSALIRLQFNFIKLLAAMDLDKNGLLSTLLMIKNSEMSLSTMLTVLKDHKEFIKSIASDDFNVNKAEKLQHSFKLLGKVKAIVAHSTESYHSKFRVEFPSHLLPKIIKVFLTNAQNEAELEPFVKQCVQRWDKLIAFPLAHYSKHNKHKLDSIYGSLLTLSDNEFNDLLHLIGNESERHSPATNQRNPFELLVLLAELDHEVPAQQYVDVVKTFGLIQTTHPFMFHANDTKHDQLRLLTTLAILSEVKQKQILSGLNESLISVKQVVDAIDYKNLLNVDVRQQLYRIKSFSTRLNDLKAKEMCEKLLENCVEKFFDLVQLRIAVVSIVFHHSSKHADAEEFSKHGIDLAYRLECEIIKFLANAQQKIVEMLKKYSFDIGQIKALLEDFDRLGISLQSNSGIQSEFELLSRALEQIKEGEINVQRLNNVNRILNPQHEHGANKLVLTETASNFVRLINRNKRIHDLMNDIRSRSSNGQLFTITDAIKILFDDEMNGNAAGWLPKVNSIKS